LFSSVLQSHTIHLKKMKMEIKYTIEFTPSGIFLNRPLALLYWFKISKFKRYRSESCRTFFIGKEEFDVLAPDMTESR